MAGLVPAIHAAPLRHHSAKRLECRGVDTRHKAGHDGWSSREEGSLSLLTPPPAVAPLRFGMNDGNGSATCLGLFRVLKKASKFAKATMTSSIFAETTASVTELKRNPMATVAAGEGFPVAILNHNEPAFYCVPVKVFEAMLERLEDQELNAIADERAGGTLVKFKLDDL